MASRRSTTFRLVESEIPRPGPGQMLLRSIYLSLDPYMRGRMNAAKSYAPPVEIGQVMEGRAVAEVVESNLPDYQPGRHCLCSASAGRSLQFQTARVHEKSIRRFGRSPTPWAFSACPE